MEHRGWTKAAERRAPFGVGPNVIGAELAGGPQ